jgi:hypothetical protein
MPNAKEAARRLLRLLGRKPVNATLAATHAVPMNTAHTGDTICVVYGGATIMPSRAVQT